MSEKRITKDDVVGNTLWIAFTELAIIHFGMTIMQIIFAVIEMLFPQEDPVLADFQQNFWWFALFLIPSAMILGYMKFTRPESLKVFGLRQKSKCLKTFGIGLLIGFLMNAFISLLVGLTGSVQYSFRGFSPLLLPVIPAVIIQCNCEEMFLRGYVPAFMEPESKWYDAAFVGGILFIFHHTSNLMTYGYQNGFCLNVFLIGVLEYLLIRRTGNYWAAAGFHSAWNYTQQYLFGLPNSGTSSMIALFAGENAKNTFFYNTVYGNEGSMITTVLLVLFIALLFYQGKGIRNAEPTE
ncbi:MAG: CPBP family intramembrane metalloprotease [Solobacterium sp.]|nr:CPBP family intramembrane metalloprotease [Solobacterium sp.]MBR3308442.1 CPBP family intramembrane metalloprotease [Lachnospiraceae bacterium]